MKIEQLPLFFSTGGALTKSKLSLHEEKCIDLDTGCNVSEIKTKHTTRRIESHYEFYADSIVYVLTSRRASRVNSLIINNQAETSATLIEKSKSAIGCISAIGLFFFTDLTLEHFLIF